MLVLLDTEVRVTYGLLFLQAPGSDPDDYEPEDPTRDWELNGLCFVAHRHGIGLQLGRAVGMVRVRIEAHEHAPPRQLRWEEVVECSADLGTRSLELTGSGGTADTFAGSAAVTLPWQGMLRFRMSASGMAEAEALDGGPIDVPGPDRYLLQVWPAPFERDRVLRQTSQPARAAHERTQRLFPIPVKPSSPRRP